MPDMMLTIPAIEKLLDYAASGIGAIAGPILAPWKASRETKARLAAAPVEAQVRRIEAESEAETSVIIAKARAEAREYLVAPDNEVHGTAEFTRRDIVQRIEFQERKRLANVRSVVDAAADELGDKEVNDHEPDPDWTARFFNEVQDVSSEDMQRIWARILAGEVESPGRTSLRTLEALKNLTKIDAEIFRDICDFVIDGEFLFYELRSESSGAISFVKLLHLQECGLINPELQLETKRNWDTDNRILLGHQLGLLLITRGEGRTSSFSIPVIKLSSIGKELCPLVHGKLNMEYLRAFSKFLKSRNYQLEYLDGIEQLADGRIRYSTSTVIEPDADRPTEAAP